MSEFYITYAPPGGEVEKWHWRPEDWTVAEIIAIEKASGMLEPVFFDAVAEGSRAAQTVLLWVVRRRTEPQLQLSDLDDMKVSYLQFWKVKEQVDDEGKADLEDDQLSAAPSPSPTSDATS